MVDNSPDANYRYRITVYTGMRRGAGTDANVFLVLYGRDGKTKPRILMDGVRKVGFSEKLNIVES